jgi:ribonuclease Z
MTPSLTIQMRPPAPPTYQTPEEAGDLFHPAVSAEDVNASLWALPALTLERFVEAQKDVIEQLGSGGVVVPKGADVRVVPLGTGSAIPTKYRNGWLFVLF